MNIAKRTLLTMLALFICVGVFAQFRSKLRKANKQYELRAYNLAVKSYLEVLNKKADNGEAMGRLADSYRHLNQMEEAAKWYSQALRQRKYDSENPLQFAHVLKALGRYDDARQWYQFYARGNPVVGNHYAQSCTFAKSQMGSPSSFIVNDELINTSASEFGPSFNGDQVVFSSARTDIQRSSANWTGKANNQLFIANIGPNGNLVSPIFLKNNIKNEFNEGPVSYAPDGRTVAFTKNNFVDGTRHIASSGMELSIYTAQVNVNGDWVNKRPFPYNGTNYSAGFPCFSPDGNTLYFASDRPDGFGGFDIYVSYKMGNSWSSPENLGPVVNSPGNEVTPYFDGSMLYFASDWHHGLGGYDIFRAEANNGRWDRIFHLGNQVNSSRDDYGFIYDNFRNIGYLTSNRPGGKGNEDIYRVSRSADNIVLRVRNASDGRPIPNAIIDFRNCGEGVFRTNSSGVYSFQAVQGLNCNLLIRAEGYSDGNLQISTMGLNNNRQYDINLSRRGEEYFGRVVDYNSQLPIEGTTVIATNIVAENTLQAASNRSGDYALALSPNATYVLRFSRPGYRDINITVQTGNGVDRSILGVTSLLPSTASNTDFPDPVLPEEPSGGQEIPSGYAIQVAAISNPNLSSFNDLSRIGQVYFKNENSKYKIRVGVFQSRREAENALGRVRSQGYPGAFIVSEKGVSSRQGRGAGTVDRPSTGSSGRYKVQLAAYRDTRWFNPDLVSDLGTIEERRRGNFTVKYVSGFNTLSEARNALNRAKSAGFNTAYIVEDINGELRKVN